MLRLDIKIYNSYFIISYTLCYGFGACDTNMDKDLKNVTHLLKYLGHYLTNDVFDDRTFIQCRNMYTQVNKLPQHVLSGGSYPLDGVLDIFLYHPLLVSV